MLVLSRKKNESIVIGDNIQIEVLKVSGNTVRIGIRAPRNVKVLRGELAPYGISDEDTSEPASKRDRNPADSVCESDSDYTIEMNLPLDSLESESMTIPFAFQSR
jgi:carbon storage regulator CsrA